MISVSNRGNEAARHERAVVALADRAIAPLDEVRALYATELARLRSGAKVQTYLQILTTASVRGILRRSGKM